MKKKYSILQLGAVFALAAILSAGVVYITQPPCLKMVSLSKL